MSKHFHCCTTFEGALKNWKYMNVMDGGTERPATLKEVQDAVDDAKNKGYTVLPPCDNVDESGHCKGHEETQPEDD